MISYRIWMALFISCIIALVKNQPALAIDRIIRIQYENENMSTQSSLQDYPQSFGNAPLGIPVDVIIEEPTTGFSQTINEITRENGLVGFDPASVSAPDTAEVTFKIILTLKETVNLSSDDIVENVENQVGTEYFIKIGPFPLSSFPIGSVKLLQIKHDDPVSSDASVGAVFGLGLANSSLHVLDVIRHVFNFFNNRLGSFSFTGTFDDLSIQVDNPAIGAGYSPVFNTMRLQTGDLGADFGVLNADEGDKRLYPAWNKYAIAHEYGHVIDDFNNLTALSIFGTPPHGIPLITDPQTALTEGWAEFIQGAAYNDATPDLAYKTSFKPQLQSLGLSLESNQWWKGGDPAVSTHKKHGEKVEGAVASVLWDLMDGRPVSGTCVPYRPNGPTSGSLAPSDPTGNPNCITSIENDLPVIDQGLAVEFDRVFQVLRNKQPKTMKEFYVEMMKELNAATVASGFPGSVNEKRLFGDVCQANGINFYGVYSVWDSDGKTPNVVWELLKGKSGALNGPPPPFSPPPPIGLANIGYVTTPPTPRPHWPVIGQASKFKVQEMDKGMLLLVSNRIKVEDAWVQMVARPLEFPMVHFENDGSGDATHIDSIYAVLSDRSGRLDSSSWQPQLNTISNDDRPKALKKPRKEIVYATGRLEEPGRPPKALKKKEGLYVGRIQGFEEPAGDGGVGRTDYHTEFGNDTSYVQKRRMVDFWLDRNAVFRFKLDLTPPVVRFDINEDTRFLTFTVNGFPITFERVIQKFYKVDEFLDTTSHLLFIQKIPGKYDPASESAKAAGGICDTNPEAIQKEGLGWDPTRHVFFARNEPKPVTYLRFDAGPPPSFGDPITLTFPPPIPPGVVRDGESLKYRIWDLAGHEAGIVITVDPTLIQLTPGTFPEPRVVCPDPGFVVSSGFGDSVAEPYRDTVVGKKLLAHLSVPVRNNLVKANVPVVGIATGSDFHSYRLEYGAGLNPETWVEIKTSRWAQEEDIIPEIFVSSQKDIYGNLGVWHTGLTEYEYPMDPWAKDMGMEGVQTLRLVVTDTWGNRAEDSVTVVVGTVIGNDFSSEVRSKDRRAVLKVPGMSMREGMKVAALVEVEDTDVPPQEGMKRVSGTYLVMPYGLDFIQPVELRVSHEALDPETGTLAMYRYNGAFWERVGGERVEGQTELAVKEKRYSGYYAIFQEAPVRKAFAVPKKTRPEFQDRVELNK